MADQPLHASAVALNGRAALITGPAGVGKSALALELIALGAQLVADDRVILMRDGEQVLARAPNAIRGLIEARGVGLLRADPLDDVPIAFVVDLGNTETDRLPPQRSIELLGLSLPLLHKVASRHFTAAVRQYLAHGRGA
jgi:HPr kinase/phosphorylase